MGSGFWSGRLPGAIFSIGAFASVSYFAFHALQGEFGLFALLKADIRLVELQTELDAARAERLEIENLARRLSPNYLDLELLDERARVVLGYMAEDEILID